MECSSLQTKYPEHTLSLNRRFSIDIIHFIYLIVTKNLKIRQQMTRSMHIQWHETETLTATGEVRDKLDR